MKRLFLFLISLGLFISVNAFAAAVCPAPKCLYVTVPTQCAGWSVGAEALYFKTSNADLDYGIVDGSPGSIPNGNVAKIDPSYKWGFGIDAGYHFAGTGNDFAVHYERLHTTDSNAVSNARIWPRFIHPGAIQAYTSANATVKYKYDAIDALLGQLVDVGHRLHTHLVAGVRAINLRSDMDAKYTVSGSGTDQAILKSSFKGIGPRFAFNGTYDLCRNFGFDAGVGTSLLIGSMKASNQQIIVNSGTYVGNFMINKTSTRQVVPELDAKLGLSYCHKFCPGKLTIMAGWKVINYFDVQDYLIYTDNSAAGVYVHSLTNVAHNGPYLGFKFQTA